MQIKVYLNFAGLPGSLIVSIKVQIISGVVVIVSATLKAHFSIFGIFIIPFKHEHVIFAV